MYESGFVTFDGELIVPALFDKSVRWNGFLCPKFDIGTCEIICKYLKVAMPQDFDYLITEYGVITKDFNYPVEDQDELWSLDENHLVSLGGWSWTWSECSDVGLSI